MHLITRGKWIMATTENLLENIPVSLVSRQFSLVVIIFNQQDDRQACVTAPAGGWMDSSLCGAA